MKRRLFAAALVLLLPAMPAVADHGKVGLWNVTSNVDITLPPELAAQMKESGAKLPTAPVTVQMCMSKEEVQSNAPPHIDSGATGCVTKIVSQSPSAMRANVVCSGQMKGNGSIAVAYQGAEHYSGSYSFKGTSYGRSTNMTTTFKGDWVKADCGKVKPYKLRTQ